MAGTHRIGGHACAAGDSRRGRSWPGRSAWSRRPTGWPSAAGMAVLEKGGNAFDAAVAAGLVLQVVEPHNCGPAGEVPIIGFAAGADAPFVLDGQGPAPAAATLDAFAALGLDLIPGTGLLAACVPAAFGTWLLLLRDYGTLRPRDVMEYAIGYAEQGYPVTPVVERDHRGGGRAPSGRDWPTSAEVYLADGVPAPGARFANPALAAVYRRILTEAEQAGSDREAQIEAARRAFYEGFVAEAIAGYLASGRGHGRQRAAAPRAADGRRPGRVAGQHRAAGDAGLPRPDRVQDRAVGPGAGVPAAARAAGRARHRGHGARRRAVRAHGRRGGQARLRRPGGVVRRSAARAGAAGRPAVGRVLSGRGGGSWPSRRPATCGQARPAALGRGCRDSSPRCSATRRRRARASRRW